jgi:hypothetical protein
VKPLAKQNVGKTSSKENDQHRKQQTKQQRSKTKVNKARNK